ncbi:MAG: NADP oxidoreductase [Micromonosporaceae bacterium]|nr:NADP oxidoreductase [Micromonosporaceae bacterium]
MKIGMLGSGRVGRTIASRLVELGHDVVVGARDPDSPRAAGWAAEHPAGRAGAFRDAASHGEVVVNATAGTASLAALAVAGSDSLAGKVLVDVANPLDFTRGSGRGPLAVTNDDSLAEQIQRAYPAVRVVKALNTVTADVMVRPELLPGPHTLFMAGDEPAAKQVVVGLLGELGWPAGDILDLGGIQAARGMEMYLPLWLSMMGALGTTIFNVHLVRS